MKTKEIIEKLKRAKKNHGGHGTIAIFFNGEELDELLQALEEQPFLGCDSCEVIAKFVGATSGICKEEKSILFNCQVDETTSCIHHSGRKETK